MTRVDAVGGEHSTAMSLRRYAACIPALAVAALLSPYAGAGVPAWTEPVAAPARSELATDPTPVLERIVNRPFDDADARQMLRLPSAEDRLWRAAPGDPAVVQGGAAPDRLAPASF